MGRISMEEALKGFDERYYKHRVNRDNLEAFGKNIRHYINLINEAVEKKESEEHIKSIIKDFLINSFFSSEDYTINTYKRVDSSISYKGKLHAIIETKKPANKSEMVRENDINKKAIWEAVFYYLGETRIVNDKKVKNNSASEIRRIIITDSREWYLINAIDLDKICNGYLEQLYFKYENGLLSYSDDTDKLYSAIKEYFEKIDITKSLNYVYFRIDEVYKQRGQWQYLYKLFHPSYLIKNGYRQLSETHVLNNRFYKELLYIMGLKEQKKDGKDQIVIDQEIRDSLIAQTLRILQDDKGMPENKATDDAYQLVIIWINRLLFIKLFEGQLLSFNGDESCYHILDTEKIGSFQDVQDLFFDVLGKKEREDVSYIRQFSHIPYLNSSLFERYEIEKRDINIRAIENKKVTVKKGTVLGKNTKELPLLQYIIDFLNAYSFSAQVAGQGELKKRNEIIDASVLGLIFEKINGYKDGSFYTKGYVTEYICKETIESAIINKINNKYNWNCKTIEDIRISINSNSIEEIKDINNEINSITICDPAVGSGHFLVSAMNYIISLKKELGVLLKHDGGRFTEYDIAVIDDILCVFDGQGNEFKYNKNDALSQSIQKTLFNEKRTIIENCLFGVDINANAVAICQLRLWIELLKNAYYENGIMETLPNIDINIKCGNSLIQRIPYATGQKLGSKNAVLSDEDITQIKRYKKAVKQYMSASSKTEKEDVLRVINQIRSNLHSVYDQLEMKSVDGNITFSSSVNETEASGLFENAFEWAIEFPEIISEEGVFGGFDCIIGNPPYIKVQDIDYKETDYFKTSFETAYERIDLSTLFIELAYRLVKKGGKVTYITSNQFLSTGYGKLMRGFLANNNSVRRIVDFGDLPVFDKALTYVSIFFLEKGMKKTKHIEYYAVKKLPFIAPKENQFVLISRDAVGDSPWELETDEAKKCLEKIRKATDIRLKAVAKCWAGAFTGKDDLLMYDLADQEMPIDKDMSITVIRADGCQRYGYATPSKRIYYPYIERDGQTVLKKLDEMEKEYPKTYQFIMDNQKILKARKDSRKPLGDKIGWYGLVRFGRLSRFKKDKIVSPGEVRHNKFCIDRTGSAFSCARVFSITIESDEVELEYLLGLLNSKLCEFYLHKTTAKKANGYYNYSAQAIDDIPIVINKEKAKEIIEMVHQLCEMTDGERKEKENELNEMIYDIYGLDEADINIIETSIE